MVEVSRFVITKSKLSSILSWLLFLISVLMIYPSGFRGDVGSDSSIYRIIYESAGSEESYFFFMTNYGFEPASSAVMSVFKKLGAHYEGVQFFVMLFSLLSMSVVFFRTNPVNFLVFIALYLCFGYYQLQWSVIRHCLAFWLLCLLLIFFGRAFLAGILSSLFHYSFLVSLLRIKIFWLFLLAPLFLGVLNFYVEKYKVLDYFLLYEFFWGGWPRLVYHLLVFFIIMGLLGFFDRGVWRRLENDRFAIVFVILFFLGLMFPLGWRLVVIALPFLLSVNFGTIGIRRLTVFVIFSFVLFLQKSYSYTVSELSAGDYSVLAFLKDFYL